jgi:hypothetical protein
MLERYPEPPEITQCRLDILNSSSDLSFNEAEHRYTVDVNEQKVELPSVSSVIEAMTPYTDWDAKAEKSAAKKGVTKAEIQRQWSESSLKSTNNGTSTHLFGEAYMHFMMGDYRWIEANPIMDAQFEDGYLIPYSPKQEAIQSFFKGVYDMAMEKGVKMYPVIAEARLHTNCYAGTADAIFGYLKDGRVNLMLYDWKTNASLTNEYSRNVGKYMLAPFNEYPFVDENLTHYIIQQSMYQICLENLNYNVVSRSLVWLKDDSTFNRVDLQDETARLRRHFGM